MTESAPPTNETGKHDAIDVRTIYGEICTNYRAIDDARTKLLGLLPLATGAGILLLGDVTKNPSFRDVALPVGLFGIVATLGLFSYELHGIKKCAYLIDAGRLIERHMRINGPFLMRPRSVAGFIDEPFAASVIYPASLAGWTYFALLKAPPPTASLEIAVVVFVSAFILSWLLIRRMEADFRDRITYCREPYWFAIREARHVKLPANAFDLPSETRNP